MLVLLLLLRLLLLLLLCCYSRVQGGPLEAARLRRGCHLLCLLRLHLLLLRLGPSCLIDQVHQPPEVDPTVAAHVDLTRPAGGVTVGHTLGQVEVLQ
jgi:hypothetical protein